MYLVSSVSAERLGFKEMKLSTCLKDRRVMVSDSGTPFHNNPFHKGDPKYPNHQFAIS